jgi:hypothetical protein
VTVASVEVNGTARHFDATVRNVSMGGLLLEAAVVANLWADKPLTIDLPGAVGAVEAVVRRFLAYGSEGSSTTRWGVEFTGLTLPQSAHLARAMFTEARRARCGAPAGDETPVPRSALHAAVVARTATVDIKRTAGPVADKHASGLSSSCTCRCPPREVDLADGSPLAVRRPAAQATVRMTPMRNRHTHKRPAARRGTRDVVCAAVAFGS